jgi:hypothetical protein
MLAYDPEAIATVLELVVTRYRLLGRQFYYWTDGHTFVHPRLRLSYAAEGEWYRRGVNFEPEYGQWEVTVQMRRPVHPDPHANDVALRLLHNDIGIQSRGLAYAMTRAIMNRVLPTYKPRACAWADELYGGWIPIVEEL